MSVIIDVFNSYFANIEEEKRPNWKCSSLNEEGVNTKYNAAGFGLKIIFLSKYNKITCADFSTTIKLPNVKCVVQKSIPNN